MRIAIGAVLALWFGTASAQELRCNQVFMNASERRICATPNLMQLDQQMGELGRRAAMHQDSFKSDQRTFRKTLKTCDGAEACLTTVYQARIAQLHSFVSTLPPPTDQEAAKLATAAGNAQEERDDQAATRDRIAEKLEAKDADQAIAEARPDMNETAPLETPQVTVAQPDAGQVQATPVEQAPSAPTLAPAERPAAAGETEWRDLALMGGAILIFLAWLKSWLNKAVRRCPGCKKWYAGKLIDQEQEAYTDYETRTFTDEHRDRSNMVTGRTRKQRQVKVRVVETTNYFQCMHCDHKWAWASQSRSS